MRERPITPRALLYAALVGRPDGRRGRDEYPAFFGHRGFVQLTPRDRQTARLLERNGLLEHDERRWRLPRDLAEEWGTQWMQPIGVWRLTELGRVIASAALRGDL